MIDQLAPPPRRLQRADGLLRVASALLLPTARNPGYRPATERLEEGLANLGLTIRRHGPGAPASSGEATVRLRLEPSPPADAAGERDGYRLAVGPVGVEITAAAPAGLYYGVETLLQWLAIHSSGAPGAPIELPAVRIEDQPVFRHRGLLVDVSRNRVPTQESLLRLVDTMAALKLNQLQLYTEHTYAYSGHEIVWRGASPLTADEIRALDDHCRRRFVELVPNQNSFGHLHRWLRHEPYRPLAEVPQGMKHPFGEEVEPFSLCPVDPGAIDLLRDLYGQLLPQFTSEQFNIGCDETFDLGKGRSAEACRERGTGRVYLEFLGKLQGLAAEHGRRIQFWGDILAGKPELLGDVPDGAVALEWGYEADHPFGERATALADAGLEFYLCPGTSSWNSFTGRLDNALANLAAAARAGAEHGASGYLIADWGDFGHLQPPSVTWPAMVAGAAFAWNPTLAGRPDKPPLPAWIDRYGEPGLAAGTGEVLSSLGNAYQAAGVMPMNASALFKLVIFHHRTLADAGLGKLTAAGLGRARAVVGDALDRLAGLTAGNPPSELVQSELRWAAEMLRFACRLGRARLAAGGEKPLGAVPAAARRELARQLSERIEELGPLWLARSRPGGLPDSRERLAGLRRVLQA